MSKNEGDPKFAGSLNHAMIDGPEGRAAQEYANSFGAPGYGDITKVYIHQKYAGYTAENQESWRTLYDRQMQYLPEPDIFHDIFGHVPLHADPIFADFLQTYGKAALLTDDPYHTERLARLFWFTVEFGLIREDGEVKLYGSGLISSPGESKHALTSHKVDRRPFDLDRVCDTSFEIDHYQPILYVLESFEQLRDAMNRYANMLLEQAGRAPTGAFR